MSSNSKTQLMLAQIMHESKRGALLLAEAATSIKTHKEGTDTGQNKALHRTDLQSQQQEITEPQLSTEIGKAGHYTSSLHKTTKKRQKSAPLRIEKTSQQDKALHELCNKTLNQPAGRYSTCK
ncbi:hypothetical protein MRB53_021606 [Persea americana]|uniref:Uncharacterized protein n=1 Tax=Persea americana TaxID=3435 RepID=A0ACC2L4C4_PERAE|nr:hypothetical protein MRB53_021606 [Persea americana]